MFFDAGTARKTETRPSDVALALMKARKLIERKECWLNHLPSMEEEAAGRHCSARAIWIANGEGSDIGCKALMALLRQTGGANCIPTWNDKPGRTHAEVLAAFDRAIAST